MSIAGKYEFVSSDKYDEYLSALGVGMAKRILANNQKPTMIYTDLGDGKWTQRTETFVKNIDLPFTLGVEFEETLADDRKSKSLITLEGETLTHKLDIEDGKYTSTITRVFSPTEMKTTFVSGDKTAVRVFKKIA